MNVQDDKERFFNKCLHSEMLHINMQKNGLLI